MTSNRIILIMAAALTLAGNAAAEKVGTVVFTMDAGVYTYVELDISGKPVWFAAPATELKPDEKVVVPAGMAMKDFHSETLNRTFDVVYFVDGLPLADASAATGTLPAGHPPVKSGAPDFGFTDIEKPDGGKAVAEVYQESATLAGKQVVVRGIAVKVTNSIMEKNWVHLQDGTGEARAYDLTITTTDTVEVGTTVTARGILTTDRDFGYGYKYDVLLEDAVLTSE